MQFENENYYSNFEAGVQIVLKISVSTAWKTHYISIKKTSR
jgi:hypothetical protein